jgi:predicted small metal-binding protein
MANTNKPDRTSTGQNTGSTNPQKSTQPTAANTTNPQTRDNQSSGRDFNTEPSVATGERRPPTGEQGDYHFRCADVGFSECKWETRGNSPDEVLRNAEQHGRQQHNLTNIDDETRNRVRSQIHKAA